MNITNDSSSSAPFVGLKRVFALVAPDESAFSTSAHTLQPSESDKKRQCRELSVLVKTDQFVRNSLRILNNQSVYQNFGPTALRPLCTGHLKIIFSVVGTNEFVIKVFSRDAFLQHGRHVKEFSTNTINNYKVCSKHCPVARIPNAADLEAGKVCFTTQERVAPFSMEDFEKYRGQIVRIFQACYERNLPVDLQPSNFGVKTVKGKKVVVLTGFHDEEHQALKVLRERLPGFLQSFGNRLTMEDLGFRQIRPVSPVAAQPSQNITD